MNQIADLTGVGVAGLAVVLMWRLITTGLRHNNEALRALKEAIHALIDELRTRK